MISLAVVGLAWGWALWPRPPADDWDLIEIIRPLAASVVTGATLIAMLVFG